MKLSPEQEAALRARHVDVELTLEILARCNAAGARELPSYSIPEGDSRIVSLDAPPTFSVQKQELEARIETLTGSTLPGLAAWLSTKQDILDFDAKTLYEFGLLLSPLLSIGVLNGGMATSYCDKKKNTAAGAFYHSVQEAFLQHAERLAGLPKSLAPAWYSPNGEPGKTFIEMRIRAGMKLASDYRSFLEILGQEPAAFGPVPCFPAFHMTSDGNSAAIAGFLENLAKQEDMLAFQESWGINPCHILERVQPLIAAFTHSSAQSAVLAKNPAAAENPTAAHSAEREIFWGSDPKNPQPFPLPGGHGQNFQTLESVYRQLQEQGKRHVYLANIDNLGSLPNATQLALLFLSKAQAGFDFSYKTAVDTKGGVLVAGEGGKLSCADIGPAISAAQVDRAVAAGRDVLFNCATGLFDLDWLCANLESIVQNLPIRLSEQNKDAGLFSQAELVTWEIIGLVDKPIIFAVDKFKRFLASKLLTDTLVTSGCGEFSQLKADDAKLAAQLQEGLAELLATGY